MGILWLIIKIILYILLAVIGLILLIVLTLIIAPFKYDAYGAYYDDLNYDVKFKYLCIKGIFLKDGNIEQSRISVFGKTIFKYEAEEENIEDKNQVADSGDKTTNEVKKKKLFGKKNQVADNDERPEEDIHQDTDNFLDTAKENDDTAIDALETEKSEASELGDDSEFLEPHKELTKEEVAKANITKDIDVDKATGEFKKTETIDTESDKIINKTSIKDGEKKKSTTTESKLFQAAKDEFWHNDATEFVVDNDDKMTHNFVDNAKDIILSGEHRPKLFKLSRHLWNMTKIVLPKDWSFEVEFSLKNPASTGILYSKLVMLYPLYYKHGVLTPKFEEDGAGVQGGILLIGKFRIVQFIKVLIRMALDKDMRLLVRMMLR